MVVSDTGVKYPATVSTTQESGDDNDWTNASSVGADDGDYARITHPSFSSPDTSYLLMATNFSMGVPAGAIINGIKVEIERYYENGTVADYDVCLTKNGTTRVGDDKSTGAAFPSSPAITTFGGAADLWGTNWTVDEVNASTFGVLYKMQATGSASDGYVDFIRVTVYYTTLTPKTSSDSGVGTESYLELVMPGEESIPAASYSQGEVASGSDIVAQAEAILSSSEAGAGAEALLDRDLRIEETGSGADALVALITSILGVETGAGLDELVELFKGIIEKFSSDTGIGTETVVSLLCNLLRSEIGSGVEGLIGRLIALSESGSGADIVAQIEAILLRSEAGSGSEILNSRGLTSPEIGSGIETLIARLLTSVELGSGLDAIVEIIQAFAKMSSDAGSGVDARVSLLVALLKAELGTGLESLKDRILALSDETGEGADASQQGATLQGSDSGFCGEILEG
jgi:hypothetical protein